MACKEGNSREIGVGSPIWGGPPGTGVWETPGEPAPALPARVGGPSAQQDPSLTRPHSVVKRRGPWGGPHLPPGEKHVLAETQLTARRARGQRRELVAEWQSA